MEVPTHIEIVAAYAAVAFSLIASLGLFISLKAEIRRLREAHAASLDGRKTEHMELWKEVHAIKQEVRILPLTIQPRNAEPARIASKRLQVLRMQEAGIPPAQIAAALCAPVQEVELAIRANQASRQEVVTEPAGPDLTASTSADSPAKPHSGFLGLR